LFAPGEIAVADQYIAKANCIVDDLVPALADRAKYTADVEIVAVPIICSLLADSTDSESMLDTRLVVSILTVALTRLGRIESDKLCSDVESQDD
jgi:hypothetical protein